jgi:hypothetical protein
LLLQSVAFSGSALAQDSIVKIQSQHSFDQTVSQVQSATSQNGLMVMGHLNQGQMLSMTGLQLKAESFLVGNPNVGKKSFTAGWGCSRGASWVHSQARRSQQCAHYWLNVPRRSVRVIRERRDRKPQSGRRRVHGAKLLNIGPKHYGQVIRPEIEISNLHASLSLSSV